MHDLSLNHLDGPMLRLSEKVHALGAALANTGRLNLPEANPNHDGHVPMPSLHERVGGEVLKSLRALKPDMLDFVVPERGLKGAFVMASALSDGVYNKVYELTDTQGHILLHMVVHERKGALTLHGWTDENIRQAA